MRLLREVVYVAVFPVLKSVVRSISYGKMAKCIGQFANKPEARLNPF
jgi:hypothetical protein